MIYFDNAATGGFKPRAVTDAVCNVVRYLSANPGRSAHRLSLAGAEIVYSTRKALAELFNAQSERVIFTKNCSEALGVAIYGMVEKDMHVITTVYEHNSVLRPLFLLKEKGFITLDVAVPEKDKSIVDKISELITEKTGLVVVSALSNVTGESLPILEIGKLCKQKNILFIVDGAQAGGHVKIDIKETGISALALACHKGLYGIMGSGALIVGDDVEISPVFVGGTGSESFNLKHPSTYPDRLESGTLNLPAIAGLFEGVRYVRCNLSAFNKILTEQTEYLIAELNKLPFVTCYSSPNPAGIVSFSVKNTSSVEVADLLNKNFDIAVRSGIHCAPLLHQYLGTVDVGLTRVSLSPQNTYREIRFFIKALIDLFEN